MSMQQMLSELTEVTPTLFISSATAITENKLNQLGINLIINATKGEFKSEKKNRFFSISHKTEASIWQFGTVKNRSLAEVASFEVNYCNLQASNGANSTSHCTCYV
jgi:hypothetical protein